MICSPTMYCVGEYFPSHLFYEPSVWHLICVENKKPCLEIPEKKTRNRLR